jgi:hypothetical protein
MQLKMKSLSQFLFISVFSPFFISGCFLNNLPVNRFSVKGGGHYNKAVTSQNHWDGKTSLRNNFHRKFCDKFENKPNFPQSTDSSKFSIKLDKNEVEYDIETNYYLNKKRSPYLQLYLSYRKDEENPNFSTLFVPELEIGDLYAFPKTYPIITGEKLSFWLKDLLYRKELFDPKFDASKVHWAVIYNLKIDGIPYGPYVMRISKFLQENPSDNL